MNTYTLASIVLSIAIIIAFLNYRFIKLPSTIAIMLGALIISIVAIILEHTGAANLVGEIQYLLIRTDFHTLLINGMLSFLLFAGAMHIDLSILKSEKWEIGLLASFSTVASTLIVGAIIYYVIPFLGLGIHIPLLFCLLFGALISPTDPIAVIAIIKKINAPRRLETVISGESLFNDGIAIVIFVTLYQLSVQHVDVTAGNVLKLFTQQALGGLAFGVALGYGALLLLKQCREINIIILITIAIVMGGYNLALALDISGPLAVIVTGIMVGDKMHQYFAEVYCKQIVLFWDIIDELLNTILFLLIGFEVLAIHILPMQIIAILCAIPIVLFARFVTVTIPIEAMRLRKEKLPYTIRVLTWGGLRGGLAVALALSLPHNKYREFFIAMTYGVVAFSIIVQGLSMKPLAKKAKRAALAVKMD